MSLIKRLWNEDEAATVVEYAIIASVIGVALIATLAAFRNQIRTMLMRAGNIIASQ